MHTLYLGPLDCTLVLFVLRPHRECHRQEMWTWVNSREVLGPLQNYKICPKKEINKTINKYCGRCYQYNIVVIVDSILTCLKMRSLIWWYISRHFEKLMRLSEWKLGLPLSKNVKSDIYKPLNKEERYIITIEGDI